MLSPTPQGPCANLGKRRGGGGRGDVHVASRRAWYAWSAPPVTRVRFPMLCVHCFVIVELSGCWAWRLVRRGVGACLLLMCRATR